jgi:hypothetical protein
MPERELVVFENIIVDDDYDLPYVWTSKPEKKITWFKRIWNWFFRLPQ